VPPSLEIEGRMLSPRGTVVPLVEIDASQVFPSAFTSRIKSGVTI
jgi:hypothetical protein